jgi:hypothetical protein
MFHLHYDLEAPQPLHVPQPRHGRMSSPPNLVTIAASLPNDEDQQTITDIDPI